MAEGDEVANDKSWLVDMVVQFMSSATWNGPLNEFVSDKCTTFDNFQEENKLEYMEVHNQYKALVDDLLTAHLSEVDILPEDFEKQCIEAGLADDPRLEQVVKQLIAVEDFVSFKQMMIDAHMSQQLQAETNFKELTAAEEAAVAREVAAAVAAADAQAAAVAVADPSYAGAAEMVVPAPTPIAKVPVPSAAPSAEQERAFGAGGGFYGRAHMPAGGKKAGSNEKASAIRKAITSACKPR